MRVSKIVLTITLILLVTVSTVTHAQVFDETKDLRGQDYSEDIYGSGTVFCAVGDSNVAYTTLTNTSESTLCLSVDTREYVYDEGYGDMHYKYAYMASGLQIVSDSVTRYKDSYIRHYYHSGTACVNQNYPSQVDDYTFIANQYYN